MAVTKKAKQGKAGRKKPASKGAAGAGRPSEFTAKMGERICKLVEESGSIRKASKAVGVARTTINRWAEENEEFATAIARAKLAGYENRAEEAVDRAKSGKGNPLMERLAFDAERWYLSKIDPRRYGDKVQTEITGKDGGAIRTAHEVDPELREAILERTAAGAAVAATVKPPASFEGRERDG